MQRPLPNWRSGRLAARLAAIRPDGPTATAGRCLGFLLLAGLALCLIAAVVLLGPMAARSRAEYEKACLDVKNANDAALIVAYQRLVEDIPRDPVLAKRLAMREFGFTPYGEIVMPSTRTGAAANAALVTAEQRPMPPEPDAWLLGAAAKVASPMTRTMLLLLAIALLAAAVMLTNTRGLESGKQDSGTGNLEPGTP